MKDAKMCVECGELLDAHKDFYKTSSMCKDCLKTYSRDYKRKRAKSSAEKVRDYKKELQMWNGEDCIYC